MTALSRRQPVERTSESVTDGMRRLGMINGTDRGFETFGPRDEYLATFPSKAEARKALFNLHRARGEDRR